MAQQEITFLTLVIKPLWDKLNDFCDGGMSVATDNINKNLKEWNAILEGALKQVESEKTPKSQTQMPQTAKAQPNTTENIEEKEKDKSEKEALVGGFEDRVNKLKETENK